MLDSVMLTFSYFYTACGFKPKSATDTREAFISMLQLFPELAHIFTFTTQKQSKFSIMNIYYEYLLAVLGNIFMF